MEQAAEPVSAEKEAVKRVPDTKFTEARGCVSSSTWKATVEKLASTEAVKSITDEKGAETHETAWVPQHMQR